MTADSAHKSRWEIAEVVFGIPFLISIAIQWFIPFSLPQGLLRQALLVIGIVLIIAGIRWIILARREFAHYAQPTDPGRPTSKVIQTGVFAVSRNPLYLGTVLVMLGFALALNNFWILATLPVSIILCHFILILPEEQYLSAKFGSAYRAYMAAVRRWYGRR